MRHVVVVGAGIVGASIAYHLAKAGAAVTVVEGRHAASGATGSSFAWIGRGPTPPRPAQAALRALVIDDYRRLEEELPDIRVRWKGSLRWDSSSNSDTDADTIDPDAVSRLEPHLVHVPRRATFDPTDGALDPVATVAALLAGAEVAGARVHSNERVLALTERDGRVVGVRTENDSVPADMVVIAAGADATTLCRDLGVDLPVEPSPSILVSFSSAPEVIRTLLSSDQIEVRQTDQGTFKAAWDHNGETSDEELYAVGQEVLARVRAAVSGMDDVQLTDVQVGIRPMPLDEDPIIGKIPGHKGAYVAVMHSGVTLAPTVGRLVAQDIIGDQEPPELAPVRYRTNQQKPSR
ncbi:MULTISPECIES: NAD(P)/FAD-dependent oxidoreductase [unclassified Curtobacterium]|uniref:NAD(P)/FAD-dependent oxidoreductase n=1 Tax=unclassified Curtobacterium TaxID=257496 RepID=UPI00226B3B87|nr:MULTISPECIES: FAD-dependent oxidoreductase [unclassified Curtobacterium]